MAKSRFIIILKIKITFFHLFLCALNHEKFEILSELKRTKYHNPGIDHVFFLIILMVACGFHV